MLIKTLYIILIFTKSIETCRFQAVFCGNWPNITVPIWCSQRVLDPKTSNSHAIQWIWPDFITPPPRVILLMSQLASPPSEASQLPRKLSEKLSSLEKSRTAASFSARPKPLLRVPPRLPSTSRLSHTSMRRRRLFWWRDSVDWTTPSTRNNEHEAALGQDICENGALPFPQRYARFPH